MVLITLNYEIEIFFKKRKSKLDNFLEYLAKNKLKMNQTFP